MTKNTIGMYREYRKRDKAIVELATRARDPEIAALLVQCLNDYQTTIRQAQADPANQDLLQKLAEHSRRFKEQKLILADAVPDKNDLEGGSIVEGKRTRKPVERYRDEDYDEVTGVKKEGENKKKKKSRRAKQESDDEDGEFGVGDGEAEYGDEYENDGILEDEEILEDEDLLEDEEILEDDEEDEWRPPARSESGEEDDEEYLALFSEGEDIPEEESESAREKRKALKAARIAMRDENQEDEGLRRLKALLSSNADRVYTLEDLEKSATLKRALELAYCARSGTEYDTPTSIHIEVID